MIAASLFAVGLSKAVAGLVAIGVAPGWLFVRNGYGIPRVIPMGLALVLAVVAVACWRGRHDHAALLDLAAWWALAAGALARPMLLRAGWPDPRFEALLIPFAFWLFYQGSGGGLVRHTRLALLAAPQAAIVTAVLLVVPVEKVPHAADAAAYAVILAAASCSLRLSTLTRRSQCPQP